MSAANYKIEKLHQALVSSLESEGLSASALTREALRPRVDGLALQSFASENLQVSERQEMVERVVNRVLGLGPLEPLLADKRISEIMVNGPDAVFVEKNGKLEKADIYFGSEKELMQVINRIVSAVGRRIDESSPLVDARLPDGSRVNAIIAPLSRVGPVLTIRRFPDEAMTLDNLEAMGTLCENMSLFLRALVLAKQNLLISGSTGSGKTSTLNALAAEVGPGERLITIEDTAEIRLVHPNLVQLEARQSNMEGKGEINIRTLLKNSLRMRPDRIIVGEVRGGEALDMLQAMNTGHQGSFTTIHANSAEEALLRLETMSMMADIELPLSAIREQVKSAVHYILHQERFPDGNRKISAISEMSIKPSVGASFYQLKPLFIYDKIERKFRGADNLPERLRFFEEAGIELDPVWFKAN